MTAASNSPDLHALATECAKVPRWVTKPTIATRLARGYLGLEADVRRLAHAAEDRAVARDYAMQQLAALREGVQALVDECDERVKRSPDRVLAFWNQRLRALLDSLDTTEAVSDSEPSTVEWGTRDDWYDDADVVSYGTETERPDGAEYARLDAERMGLTLMRRRVTEWEAVRDATPPSDPDPWCRDESCRHRTWRSGTMPTHRRGDDCPAPPSDDSADALFIDAAREAMRTPPSEADTESES